MAAALAAATARMSRVRSWRGLLEISGTTQVTKAIGIRHKSCLGATEQTFLSGRVALVTGSTSGIGLGVARGLAARGATIILNGFGDDQLIRSLRSEFKSYGTDADYVNADLTSAAEVDNMCDVIKQRHPDGVDIIFNNAGFQHVSPVEQFEQTQWAGLIGVLLTAPFQLIRNLLPDMKRKGWGRVVNLASVHGHRASPNKAGYVSAKHGIVGLTKVVALECAGSGITCNAICPGYVDTPILQMQVKEKAEKEGIPYEEAKKLFLAAFHPSREAVGIDHLAEMTVFLCTDACSQMTGSSLVVDGGWTAH